MGFEILKKLGQFSEIFLFLFGGGGLSYIHLPGLTSMLWLERMVFIGILGISLETSFVSGCYWVCSSWFELVQRDFVSRGPYIFFYMVNIVVVMC